MVSPGTYAEDLLIEHPCEIMAEEDENGNPQEVHLQWFGTRPVVTVRLPRPKKATLRNLRLEHTEQGSTVVGCENGALTIDGCIIQGNRFTSTGVLFSGTVEHKSSID